MAYTLTIWTQEGEPRQFEGATRELTLRALRRWMNGLEPDGAFSLTCYDRTGTDDSVLERCESSQRWRVRWYRFADRYFANWDGATGAADAFVDACACKVADLDARCRCAHPGCGKELIRAWAPWIPGVGWVCFDDLIWYVGSERTLAVVTGEICETEFSLSDAEAERLLDLGYGIEG